MEFWLFWLKRPPPKSCQSFLSFRFCNVRKRIRSNRNVSAHSVNWSLSDHDNACSLRGICRLSIEIREHFLFHQSKLAR